jgi:large subunit ribosomal protein L16
LPLQPKNFRSKKIQKSRKIRYFKTHHSLRFGNVGLMLVRPLQFTGGSLFRLRLFLKKGARKSDKTRRFMWFNAFPHLPLTKKPTGLRMGKGKGKLSCWFTNIRGGVTLVEFRNLRWGRSSYFISQLKYKLGVPVSTLYSDVFFFNLPLSKHKSLSIRSFW